MIFALQFEKSLIGYWAQRYTYPGEDEMVGEIGPMAQERGYFDKQSFLKLCRWKSPRTQPRCAENEERYIREVTRIALSTPEEQLRIEVLTLLRGVEWPTASVIVHFAHTDPYPILDFRALWSLGMEQPKQYDFALWWAYTQYCRELARSCGVSMRTLDRALWQYSKEKQPSRANTTG